MMNDRNAHLCWFVNVYLRDEIQASYIIVTALVAIYMQLVKCAPLVAFGSLYLFMLIVYKSVFVTK